MLTFTQALNFTSTALDLAKRQDHEIAVEVVDSHCESLSFAKMHGTAFHAAKSAGNKASARDR